MTEKEKMLAGELYIHRDEELTKERGYLAEQIKLYNEQESELHRTALLKKILGEVGKNVEIKSPFLCDYGYNIKIGNNVFVNYNCTFLDCNRIEIGDNVLIAPNVQMYAATHPTDYNIRLKNLEYAKPIIIGNNVWIGGGSIICSDVTIGENTTIGAGSVVVNDIPANCVAAGNPCKVISKKAKEKTNE